MCRKPYFYNNKSIQNSSINLLETFMIKCLLDTTPSEKGSFDKYKNSVSFFLSFFLYVLTSMEDIRRGSVYKWKGGVS